MIIFAKSLGLTEQEFWKMTPHELYIENQAFETRFKRENIINLQLLNAVSSFLGGKALSFDDFLGYKTLKDYNFKTVEDFREGKKVNFEKWNKYIEEVIKPAKKELGLEVE